MSFCIRSIGMYVPEYVLTNKEMEEWAIGASDRWMWENIGIKERRICHENQTTSDLAAAAAEIALRNADLSPGQIDLIVMATITPDFLLPHTSSVVKQKINASNAACFDIQAGCAGFVFGAINAVSYALCNDEIKNILVVAADTVSKVTDWKNRNLCSAVGDGAGAFVIQKIEKEYGIKTNYIYHENMKDINCAIIPSVYGKVPRDLEVNFTFDGRYLYEIAKNYIPHVIDRLLEKAQWRAEDIDLFLFPQVNKSLAPYLLNRYGVDQNKTHTIMERYGYTYSSCIPIALYDAVRENKLSKGDKIVLIGSGAGCYCAGIALEWSI